MFSVTSGQRKTFITEERSLFFCLELPTLLLYVISGFYLDVGENFALLGYLMCNNLEEGRPLLLTCKQ
jgi:predicted anti-sigma-YlaC factor YlaD